MIIYISFNMCVKGRINALVADLHRQAQLQGTVLDPDNVEEYAMTEIISSRRDWYVGVGPSISKSALVIAQAQDDSSSSDSSSRRGSDPAVIKLQNQLAEQQAAMAAQQAAMEEMQRQMFAFSQQFSSIPPYSSDHSIP